MWNKTCWTEVEHLSKREFCHFCQCQLNFAENRATHSQLQEIVIKTCVLWSCWFWTCSVQQPKVGLRKDKVLQKASKIRLHFRRRSVRLNFNSNSCKHFPRCHQTEIGREKGEETAGESDLVGLVSFYDLAKHHFDFQLVFQVYKSCHPMWPWMELLLRFQVLTQIVIHKMP